MSLFIVVVPTREQELSLRKKELVIHSAVHLTPTGSKDSNSSDLSMSHNDRNSVKYMALTGGRPMEIIVGDDFMEIKETTPEASASFSGLISSQLLEDDKIQAEIEKYFLEKHLEDTLEVFSIANASWTTSFGGTMSQVEFTVSANITDTIIQRLQSVGIGIKYDSSITVCTADVYYGPVKYVEMRGPSQEDEHGSGWSEFVQSIKSRLTVAQVVSQIRSMTTLTFDYIMFVIVAALIACLGLLDDNSVILVASMLISPLMGPIMAFTFGSVIRDYHLIMAGVKSEIIGLSLCLITGFISGCFLAAEAFEGVWDNNVIPKWPTNEMISRGKTRSLIVGVMMAIPSGVGVALSLLAGNAGSLVGVAISASLLPPAVNCGLFWGLAFVIWLQEGPKGNWGKGCNAQVPAANSSSVYYKDYSHMYCANVVHEYARLGIYSFGLTGINIVVIFVVAVLILKIKEVAPYTTRKSLRRFWQEDLAFTRKYNNQHHGLDINAGIMHDLNSSEDAEALKKKLNQDHVFKQINKRIIGGGGGDVTVLNEMKLGINAVTGSDIELPRQRKAKEEEQRSKALTQNNNKGWFGGWLGGGK